MVESYIMVLKSFLIGNVGIYNYAFSSEHCFLCTPQVSVCCDFVSMHLHMSSTYPSDFFFFDSLSFRNIFLKFHIMCKFPKFPLSFLFVCLMSLFIGCPGSSLLHGLFSSCSVWLVIAETSLVAECSRVHRLP